MTTLYRPLCAVSLLLLVINLVEAAIPTPEGGDILDLETKLYNTLLHDYNPYVRPSDPYSETVNVSFGINVLHIMDVDEKGGSITFNAYLKMAWTDRRLKWNTTAYDGVYDMRIPIQQLWKPDIVLLNSASEQTDHSLQRQLAIVSNSGTVVWVPQAILHAKCYFDMGNFPFDHQTCPLRLGSWTGYASKINLTLMENLAEIDLTHLTDHTEWHVKGSRGQVDVVYYDCCGEPHSEVTYELDLQRRHSYYIFMLVSPPLLISLLLPFIFVLPNMHAHRYVIGIGGVVSMTVLMESVEFIVPAVDGTIPILGRYYVGVFVLTFLAVISSAVITNLAFRSKGTAHPSEALKTLAQALGRILLVDHADYDYEMHYSGAVGDNDDIAIVQPERKRFIAEPNEISDWRYLADVLDRLLAIMFATLVTIIALVYLLG